MTAWFVNTYKRSGEISVLTTGESQNAIAGAAVGFGVGGVSAVLLSYIFPKQYHSTDPAHVARNQKVFGTVKPVDDDAPLEEQAGNPTETKGVPEEAVNSTEKEAEVGNAAVPAKEKSHAQTGNEVVDFLTANHITPLDPVAYKKGLRLAIVGNVIFFFVGVIIFPFVFFGTKYTASRSFFDGYVGVSFLWAWITGGICVIWPIVESREQLLVIFRGLTRDAGGLRRNAHSGVAEEVAQ